MYQEKYKLANKNMKREVIMPQDPRVTEESLEYVDMFFGYVAGNCITELSELLDLLPDLIYARDKDGDTALYCKVGRGREEDLKTAQILMAYGAEPDKSNVGIALQLIDDPYILHRMAAIVGIDIKYKNSDNIIEQAEAYFERPDLAAAKETHEKIAKPAKKKGFFSKIFNLQEIKYDNDINAIFKNLLALNMDQQKEANKINMNIESLLKPCSLGLFAMESSSENLPLTLIPNEFSSYSYEQISHILGKIQDYFYGDPSNEA